MDITRRSVVKSTGTIPIAALAGCIGGGLEVEGIDSRSTMGGNVIVAARVSNGSSSAESGTLRAEVDLQDGETYTQTKQITVDGDSTEDFEVKFDIPIGDSLSGARYDYDAEIE